MTFQTYNNIFAYYGRTPHHFWFHLLLHVKSIFLWAACRVTENRPDDVVGSDFPRPSQTKWATKPRQRAANKKERQRFVSLAAWSSSSQLRGSIWFEKKKEKSLGPGTTMQHYSKLYEHRVDRMLRKFYPTFWGSPRSNYQRSLKIHLIYSRRYFVS